MKKGLLEQALENNEDLNINYFKEELNIIIGSSTKDFLAKVLLEFCKDSDIIDYISNHFYQDFWSPSSTTFNSKVEKNNEIKLLLEKKGFNHLYTYKLESEMMYIGIKNIDPFLTLLSDLNKNDLDSLLKLFNGDIENYNLSISKFFNSKNNCFKLL